MGITERQWIVKAPADAEKAARLSTELGIDRVLADLLVQRGVETFEQARSFFRPRLEDLHNPFLMKDMNKAVERLHQAITEGQKILVYGDYDVDGTTAVAQVYSFVKQFTSKVSFYIPDRYDEGYGLSYKALDWAADNGINLVITLDCGIKAIEKVEYARAKGIDIIITFPRNSCLGPLPSWTPSGKTATTPSTTSAAAAWASNWPRDTCSSTAWTRPCWIRFWTCRWFPSPQTSCP